MVMSKWKLGSDFHNRCIWKSSKCLSQYMGKTIMTFQKYENAQKMT